VQGYFKEIMAGAKVSELKKRSQYSQVIEALNSYHLSNPIDIDVSGLS
jgi:hypothetical protein